jgi:hypothetical protein
MSRARGRRSKHRYRKRGEELELERAFGEAWAQRAYAWDPRQHTTPMGVCFPTTEAWRCWLARVHERYASWDPDLLTVSTGAPVVLVLFQRPDGEWLDAAIIDALLQLAHRPLKQQRVTGRLLPTDGGVVDAGRARVRRF